MTLNGTEWPGDPPPQTMKCPECGELLPLCEPPIECGCGWRREVLCPECCEVVPLDEEPVECARCGWRRDTVELAIEEATKAAAERRARAFATRPRI
jgi:hypothetical protein